MRTTIVPAQITTVEDRIAGRLGLSQLLLLVSPIFGGSAVFVIFPPFFNYATYKVVLIACVAALSALLAIRVRGKILLGWALVLLRYNVRPRYYLFNKNSSHTRTIVPQMELVQESTEEDVATQIAPRPSLPRLNTYERMRIETLIADPSANVHITANKKGELSVHLTEVQHESLSATAN